MDLNQFLAEWFDSSDKIKVHTSGSTGQPKTIWLNKEKMRISARQTCSFLGLKPHDVALLCMPLDYIAGKMMAVRADTCQLHLISVPPTRRPLERLVGGTGKAVHIDFAAMIPMQVLLSLEDSTTREVLKSIRHLIIGGGPINALLEKELKDFPNAVWSTYGMTETMSHIALRRLSGKDASQWYEPFAGVSVALDQDDRLMVTAPAILDETITTNDIAELHPDGRRFRILGRKDNVICSGGIKIQMEEVEEKLRPVVFGDFAITKCPHPVLGECVVMLTTSADVSHIKQLCADNLPRYWVPKEYVSVTEIPLTPSGKIARKEAFDVACSKLKGKLR